MAIPRFDELFNEVLEFLSDEREHKTSDVKKIISDNLNLSDEERSQTIKSRDEPVIVNRLGWTITGLKKAGFVEYRKWGHVNITERGLNEYSKNQNITIDDLMDFPEFEEWITGRTTKEDYEIVDGEKLWLVRAGPKSVKIKDFLNNNLVAISWKLQDLVNKNDNEIKSVYLKKNPNEKSGKISFDVSQITKFVNEIKIGDYVLSGDSSTKDYYLGKITSDYYYSDIIAEKNGEFKHCRNVKWLCTIKRDDLSDDAKNPLQALQAVLEIKDEIKDEFLLFYKSLPFSTHEKRNIIFFGAPGTGKSFNLNEKRKKLLKGYENNYERVTFHPDYSYANFVGTYKPVPKEDTISYEYVPGPFMRILIKALKTPSEPFILIIEEINRANVAAVFGDIFQLLDRDKSTNCSEYHINTSEDMKNYIENELSESKMQESVKKLLGEHFDKIRIPSNMFIWATMNSADQGVFPMDTAFKRRWNFEYFNINHNDDKIVHIKINLNNKEFLWNDIRKLINDELISYRINEDKLIGPFFAFEDISQDLSEEEYKNEFKEIFKNKIIMYLFEDVARARRNDLFQGARQRQKNKDNITYYQICDDFDKNELKIFSKNIRKELELGE